VKQFLSHKCFHYSATSWAACMLPQSCVYWNLILMGVVRDCLLAATGWISKPCSCLDWESQGLMQRPIAPYRGIRYPLSPNPNLLSCWDLFLSLQDERGKLIRVCVGIVTLSVRNIWYSLQETLMHWQVSVFGYLIEAEYYYSHPSVLFASSNVVSLYMAQCSASKLCKDMFWRCAGGANQ
jgi:hypothetical protein